ncbi:MAG: hypothetical protein Q9220_002421 [cf. Caloplaca sp. 1 TL-2023]
MATIIPPPSKRQRTAIAQKAREQQDVDIIPKDLGSVRVYFTDRATGLETKTVLIPVADGTRKNLELLANTLRGNVRVPRRRSIEIVSILNHEKDATERVPYQLTYDTGSQIINIDKGIYQALAQGGGPQTTEPKIGIQYDPQAIFRVRAVSRCSSAIPGHGEPILTTSFASASSSRLVTGSSDKTARIFDTDTGTPLHTLKGHTDSVLVVSWSPDDTMIATGSMDNTVRLWDPKTGQALGKHLKGHTKWVRSLAWEPYHLRQSSSSRLASSSKDTTIRIWDTGAQNILYTLSGHTKSVSCVRWGGTGIIYTSSDDTTIKLWNSNNGSLITTLTAHAHWVNHLALSTGFVLRTGYHDHTGTTPTTDEEKLAKAKRRFEASATVNGKITESFVSASDDHTMYLWLPSTTESTTTYKSPIRLLGHQQTVIHVAFSPQAHVIASASFDKSIKLWSATTGQFIGNLRGHVDKVYMIGWSPDSRWLVSGSKDTTVKIWDVNSHRLKEDLPGHRDEVYGVDWSPDGGGVASGGKDKQVRVWKH